MRRYTLFIALCAGIVCSFAQANSNANTADQWLVTVALGEVSLSSQGKDQTHALTPGRLLTAPFSVKTGTTGQVVLVRGEDTLMIAPLSEIVVRAATQSEAGLVTRILQSIGSLVYKVEKRPEQRFEVETPYLVSVVKGTTFTISVTERDTVVSLEEGSLQVLSKDGAHRALMRPGEIARSQRGLPQINVRSAVEQRSDWGDWHPLNSAQNLQNTKREQGPDKARIPLRRQDLKNPERSNAEHGRSDAAPGRLKTTPGLTRTLPGRLHAPTGHDHTPPGRLRTPPGQLRTPPGLSRNGADVLRIVPGRLKTPPGQNKKRR